MNAPIELLTVRVNSIKPEAPGISAIELVPVAGGSLPPFTAGAHVDLHLANGMVRSYSLVNPQDESHRYVVAVANDPASRGGSRFIHDTLRAGDTLQIGAPRNNFALAEQAPHTLLISGGIGITPLLCMIERLESLGRSWELYLCARSRGHAAFLERIDALAAAAPARVHLNFDDESGGKFLDIAAVVSAQSPGAHLYCCGPLPMLEAFEKATAARPPQEVHVEYFTAKEGAASTGGFTVVLAKSGKTLEIQPGQTILDAVLDAKISVSFSCTEGVCGCCETAVIEGTPDHRDLVLSKEEHAANKTMMICCSGSKSAKLVLDL